MNTKKKSFNASLVGLQYHRAPINVYDAVTRDFISLKRDTNNQHDKNAIEVIIRTYKVGYIDKTSASIFASLLDSGYSYQVSCDSVNLNHKSIKLAITFYIPEVSTLNKPVLRNVAGIYKITANQTQQVYVGQSINIRERISSHWDALQFNSHSNKNLQSLWNELGNTSFSASIVESVPNNITSDLEKQRWLGEREIYWIQQSRSTGKCLNITDGEIVPTKRALEEYELEQTKKAKEHDEKIRTIKEALNIEINDAKQTYESAEKEFRALQTRVNELNKFINDNTGIWGFLSGSTKRIDANRMRPQLETLKRDLELIRGKFQISQSIYLELKTKYSNLKSHKQIQRDLDKLAMRMGRFPNKKRIL